jgi:thioredoxin 1
MATENAQTTVQTLTDGNFEDAVIKANAPVLVDFWAPWCGPCKQLAPTVEALATEYAGKLTVGKMNVDENPTTPEKFQIRGIPTLLIFKGGQVVDSVVGAVHKDAIKERIDKHI